MHLTKIIVLHAAGVFGAVGMNCAQAASCVTPGACFSFEGGGPSVDNGLSAPTGSWFAYLAADSNSDGVPDTSFYTAMNAVDSTATPGPNGELNFTITNTITPNATGYGHNSGNMIDRDWSFLAAYGAHYTNGALPVSYAGGNTATVDMSNWQITWNGFTIDVSAGAPAIINNNDGIWGNGNDTLDYSAIIPDGGYANVLYTLHLIGSYAPVPVPATAWLLGSGLIGLLGVARRARLRHG